MRVLAFWHGNVKNKPYSMLAISCVKHLKGHNLSFDRKLPLVALGIGCITRSTQKGAYSYLYPTDRLICLLLTQF
jgi:hypothetical protein